MDAERALADLIEVSSQIEGAVLLGPDGTVAASSFGDDGRAERVAVAARELVSVAEDAPFGTGREALTQLHATSSHGSVFCVRGGDRMIAAVTKPDPTVGLVLYDLRTCLRLAAEESKKPARARKPRKTAEKEPEDA
jgi:predicted regulator of Ras-like GTPase activity (Roadblock/LC7/MglB family)